MLLLQNRLAHSVAGPACSTAAIVLLMLAALSAGAPGVAMAQTGGGATLVGTVKDSSGGLVAGAKVSVVNTGTSFLSESTTTPEGSCYILAAH